MEPHLTATDCHLPYVMITQCYLPTDTSEHMPNTQAHSIYLPGRDGRLSWPRWLVTYRDGLPAHRRSPIPSTTNRAQCRLTTLIESLHYAATTTPSR